MDDIVKIIKTAARIKHDKLDDELLRLSDTATKELIRVGISEKAATSNDPLIMQAKVTYCLMNLTEDHQLIDGYKLSFESQIDGIRKSSEYKKGGEG